MGNRRHHKKLRAEVRARMSRTGESYQKALVKVRDERRTLVSEAVVDLVPIEYFGIPAALATYELFGRLACVVVSSPHRPAPFPDNVLVAFGPAIHRSVH